MPDTREALIEGLARADYEAIYASVDRSDADADWDTEREDIKDCYRSEIETLLSRIEAAGCMVVPQKVTPVIAAVISNGNIYWTGEELWREVLAASPFAKREGA